MSNLSTLQTLVNWANAGVIISLALSFVFGAASILLGGRLGKLKDSQAATAQRDLELAVSTQQERAAKAERDLLDLKQRVKSRHLTREQRARFLVKLQGQPKSSVFIAWDTESEAQDFAQEIATVLEAAGWTANIVETPPIYGDLPPARGIWIRYTPSFADAANLLHEALKQAGVQVDAIGPYTPEYRIQGEDFRLYIGPRPLGRDSNSN
jgi:hypothetical protein